MSEDLTALPLKSLELPSKTVAKLKPLGIRTVGDLYARTPRELAAAGLLRRELDEIAEAAGTFGVTWGARAELDAAAAAPAAPAPPAKPKAAPDTRTAKLELPPDVVTAFSVTAATPVALNARDLAFFDQHVDASKRNFKTPPPSPKHLRLVRRIALVRGATIGGREANFVVALIDVSQIAATDVETFVVHVGNLIADVLARIGVKQLSQSFAGCAVQLTIAAKDVPKARALVAAHARWIGDGPAFLATVPPALAALAAGGERAFT